MIEKSDYSSLLFEGIYLIQIDSVESGIEKFTKGLELLDKTENTKRISDYTSLELISLLQYYETGKLSKEQEVLFKQFIRNLFVFGKINIEEQVDSILKNEKKDEISLRLKIFSGHLNKDSTIVSQNFDELLLIDSTGLPAIMLKAGNYFNQKKWEESKLWYSRVINQYSNSAYAYLNRGSCNRYLELYDEAESDIKKSLELYPDYPLAINELGVLFLEYEEFEKVIA